MVAIQHHGVAFDFQDIENGFTAIGCSASQLPPHLHARREIFLGHGLQQVFIALTEGIGSTQYQGGLIAFVLAIQRLFNFGQGVFITTMQISHGLLCSF